jgi:hypothetical protein
LEYETREGSETLGRDEGVRPGTTQRLGSLSGLVLQRGNFVVEVAILRRLGGALLRRRGNLVQFVPRNPNLFTETLGLIPHGFSTHGIGEAVPVHDVLHLHTRGGHRIAPPRAGIHVEPGVRHRLGAARQHEIGLSRLNHRGPVQDRHHAGRAHHVHGVPVAFLRDARLQGGLTGNELPLTGPEDISKHVDVEAPAVHTGPVEGRLHDGSGQIYGRMILERSPKAANGRSNGGGDVGVTHKKDSVDSRRGVGRSRGY